MTFKKGISVSCFYEICWIFCSLDKGELPNEEGTNTVTNREQFKTKPIIISNILIEGRDYIHEIRKGRYKVGPFRGTRKGVLGNHLLSNQETAWRKSVRGNWQREGKKMKELVQEL